jgi:uncharacterized protein YndB with AHSA1/START domain
MAEQRSSTVADREFILTRLIDAPRELVFKAWTDPKLMAQWWGPHGFTNPVCEVDLRPGGAYRIVMRGPDGVDYPVTGVYREIVSPERIVVTDDCSEHPAEWQDAILQNLSPSERTGSLEAINTVTFEEQGGKTLLTIRTLFHSTAVREAMVKMGMSEGWSQSFERLEEFLKTV